METSRSRPALRQNWPVWLAGALLAGCGTPPTAVPPPAAVAPPVATQASAIVLEPALAATVSCPEWVARRLADGRLDLIANLRNLSNVPVALDAQCAFTDEHGAGPAPSWDRVRLAAGATETLHFTAASEHARFYTLRVHPARNTPAP